MSRRKLVCVIGLGQFGSELARSLASSCEVLALDMDEHRVNELSDHVQRALCLDARDYDALASVVSSDFDEGVVSMGENLEASILCTLHLSQIGVRSIRSKAVTEDQAAILRLVGANEVIFPERETARRLAAGIVNPNLVEFIPLEEDYSVRSVVIPAVFFGHSMGEVRMRTHYDVFVVAMRRQTEPHFVFLPKPDYVFGAGDVATMIGREKDLNAAENASAMQE